MSTRHNLLGEFYQDLAEFGLLRPDVLAQVAVVLLALLLAWLVNRAVKRDVVRREITVRGSIGREGLARLLFPLMALAFTHLGGWILQSWFTHGLKLIGLASVLLMAMASIRLLANFLRHIFKAASWVEGLEKTVAIVVWVIYALHVMGVLPELWQFLGEIELPLVKGGISLLSILQGCASIAVTVLAALWIGSLIESRLMQSEVMDINLRVMAIKVTRALLIVLAVLVALPLVGIDLTVLSVFGGALGVGLGFGLQKIASNYVSGFIILMDRSVKIGDMVQIDNRQGIVAQLTSRYIVLRGLDGNDALIPNETLITSTVINQSFTSRQVRVVAQVQVAYGTDLEQVLQMLVDAGVSEPRVLADPAPAAFVKSFGDNGINLELGVWIGDPENGALPVQSAIYLKIWHVFQQQGINIPYPQREMRVVPAPGNPATTKQD